VSKPSSPSREWTRLYEKTPNGFLMRAYRNMESRVTGVQKKKAHLYAGLELMPRDEFYLWAHSSRLFWDLWRVWKQAGHPRKLTPSVNRKDPERGYVIDNIEWLTHSANSANIRRAGRLTCVNGHEWVEGSYYDYRDRGGQRVCKECSADRRVRYLAAKRTARQAQEAA
jgi:hypothetical protein